MDTERMKRVLERVYGPVAPTEEKQAPDALREGNTVVVSGTNLYEGKIIS